MIRSTVKAFSLSICGKKDRVQYLRKISIMLMKPVVYLLNKHNSVIKIELVKIVERSFQSAFAVTAYCYLMKIFFVAI